MSPACYSLGIGALKYSHPPLCPVLRTESRPTGGIVHNSASQVSLLCTGSGFQLLPSIKPLIESLGTAFSLEGFLSPESGHYSVTLDGETSTLTAQSSFLQSDILFYYAMGLNASAEHVVTISNDEGKLLALKVGGIQVTTEQDNPAL
jgi:hypothetical protein